MKPALVYRRRTLRPSREAGMTMVLVAVAMIAIAAMAALSIDLVTLYLARMEAQRAADAGALAAARVISLGPDRRPGQLFRLLDTDLRRQRERSHACRSGGGHAGLRRRGRAHGHGKVLGWRLRAPTQLRRSASRFRREPAGHRAGLAQ